MKIALGTLPEPDLDIAARQAESIFADRFASKPAKPPLVPATHTWELDLKRVPARGKVFGFALPPGSLAFLFTQHHPDEFRLRLESSSQGGIAPLLERTWKGTHEHSAAVMSVGLEVEGDLDLHRVEDWMGELLTDKGADLFRYKGILAIAGRPARLVLQGVHMLLDNVNGALWGIEPRRSRMVFIGRDLDRKALSEGFRACRK